MQECEIGCSTRNNLDLVEEVPTKKHKNVVREKKKKKGRPKIHIMEKGDEKVAEFC